MEVSDSGFTYETPLHLQGCVRVEEEVSEILQLAVIPETDLNTVTQLIHPPLECSTTQNIKLLEIDDHLLEAVESGGRYTQLLSLHSCDIALWAYYVPPILNNYVKPHIPREEAGYSETDMDRTDGRILKSLGVKGIFHTYYEVRECKPRLVELLALLEASAFKGVEYESSIEPESLYTWSRLRSEIQASDDELGQALADNLIVEMKGYYRLISFEAEVKCVGHMLELFDTNSWEIDEVDREAMYDALRELIPESVFDALFRKYTVPSAERAVDGRALYRFVEEMACKILAKVLLSSSPVTEYSQFMESWNIGTPEKMKPTDEYLRGIALVVWNDKVMRKEVISFPEEKLPKTIGERFNELFKAKSKWMVQEIAPYVSGLTTSKMNVNALLTKYARCSTINGVKHYSAKHGK